MNPTLEKILVSLPFILLAVAYIIYAIIWYIGEILYQIYYHKWLRQLEDSTEAYKKIDKEI